MGRPAKNYCDYFPHDRDMRNHRKIKAIRNKFGISGYAIWVMVLEDLTGSDGNVLEYSEIQFDLMAGDYGVPSEEIKTVIDYCIRLELLFTSDGFFHSESLDDRLSSVYDKRNYQKQKSKKQLRVNGKFASEKPNTNGIYSTEKP